jgi:hypothetical protein
MNNIEDGIYDAHEAVSAEEQARIQGDENTLTGALEAIYTHVPRRRLQSDWNDDDLEIGAKVMHNGQQMIVLGIIVLGGKFPAAEGGNRPTFVLGGVQRDVQREIYGKIANSGGAPVLPMNPINSLSDVTGAFLPACIQEVYRVLTPIIITMQKLLDCNLHLFEYIN